MLGDNLTYEHVCFHFNMEGRAKMQAFTSFQAFCQDSINSMNKLLPKIIILGCTSSTHYTNVLSTNTAFKILLSKIIYQPKPKL